jgi:hypothetical protein
MRTMTTRMALRRKAKGWIPMCSLLICRRCSLPSLISGITRRRHRPQSLTVFSVSTLEMVLAATPRSPRWARGLHRGTTFAEWARPWWASRLGLREVNRHQLMALHLCNSRACTGPKTLPVCRLPCRTGCPSLTLSTPTRNRSRNHTTRCTHT